MKVVAAEWLPYRLPLKRPWQTSQGVLKKQSGSLLRLETKDGQTGWGDCAPPVSYTHLTLPTSDLV